MSLWGKLLPACYHQQGEAQTSLRDAQAPAQLAASSSLTHCPQRALCSGHSRFPNGACFLIPPCLCLGCSLRLRCPSPHLHLDSYPCLRTQLRCFSSQKASSKHSPPIRPTSPSPRPQSVCACPPSLSCSTEHVIMPLFSSLCPPASLGMDLSGKSIVFIFDSLGPASCQAHSRCPLSVC